MVIGSDVDLSTVNLFREDAENRSKIQVAPEGNPLGNEEIQKTPRSFAKGVPQLNLVIAKKEKKPLAMTLRTPVNRALSLKLEGANLEPFDTVLSPRIKIIGTARTDIIDPEIEISNFEQVQPEKILVDPELSEKISGEDAVSSLSDEVPPENLSDRTEEDPQERQRVQRDLTTRGAIKTLRRQVAASQITPLTGTAPNSSKKLAMVVKLLILNNPSSSVSDTVRALNMIQCAAGGGVPSPDSEQPETKDCAVKLSNLLPHERYDFLQALFDQLTPYLRQIQRQVIERYLDSLKQNAGNTFGLNYTTTMTLLKSYLEEEILSTMIKNMAEPIEQMITTYKGDYPKSSRALNMVFCAAGGRVEDKFPFTGGSTGDKIPLILVVGVYPEMDAYAQKLINLPDANRYAYVKMFFDQLSPHLTHEQNQLVKNSLEKLDNIKNNPALMESELYSLRQRIQTEFFNTPQQRDPS